MKIGSRIAAGFGVLVIMLAAVGLIGWSSLGTFRNGVDLTQQLQNIGRHFQNADGLVREFTRSGDPALIEESHQSVANATSEIDQVSTSDPKLSERLEGFRSDFTAYSDKSQQLKSLFESKKKHESEMAQRSQAISANAANVVERVDNQFRSALDQLQATAETRKKSGLLKNEAENLIRATLSTRTSQNEYIDTNLPDVGERTKDGIKQMFLSALKLKKLAKGQATEKAATTVAGAVGNYRKAFGTLVDAINNGESSYEMEEALRKESARVSSFTTAVANAITAQNEKAEEVAAVAQEEIETAAFHLNLGMNIVADVERANANTAEFAETGLEKFIEETNSALERIRFSAEKLGEMATDPAMLQIVGLMINETAAYADEFAAFVDVKRSFDTLRVEMIAMQERISTDISTDIETEVSSLDALFGSSSGLIIGTSIASVVVGILLALLIARSITRPVGAMTGAMRRLADNDLEVDIPGADRKDEIADMAKAVQVFKDNSIKVRQLQAEQEALEKRQKEEQAAAMRKMADEFEASVGKIVEGVAAAATELQATAGAMSSSASTASEQSAAVAGTVEQASGNVSTVAAAAEELSSSISEIARQVAESSSMTEAASREASETDAKVKNLDEAADRIGAVVALITDIAEQTNLLALNATIEAARAGDAGKGFAVVANEVKNLANQTAKATEEISQQIGAIQAETNQTVGAISRILEAIQRVNDVGTAIASAVEEQGAATQEIARNTQEAARGTATVSDSIRSVSHAVEETGSASGSVLTASEDLSRQSEQLNSEIRKFLSGIRT